MSKPVEKFTIGWDIPPLKELLSKWKPEIIPENCYFRRFAIVPEYDQERDLLLFWVEWPYYNPKYPDKTYCVVVSLKEKKNSSESTLELWVERKLAKKRTLTHCVDADPIKAMKCILEAFGRTVTKK